MNDELRAALANLSGWQADTLRRATASDEKIIRLQGGGVGAGTALVNLLLPGALDSEVAVLFVEPVLVDRYGIEQDRYKQLPVSSVIAGSRGRLLAGRPVLHVMSHASLARSEGRALLFDLKPDLVVCEARVFHPHSVRSLRLAHYMQQSNARCCLWEF